MGDLSITGVQASQHPFNAGQSSATEPTFAVEDANDLNDHAARSSPNALARFEYEAGRTSNCTKVLMVEWEEDDMTRAADGFWEIGWTGKQPVAFRRDLNRDVNRLYFLLSTAERIPEAVHLTLRTPLSSTASAVWQASPLPAIFSPELGASAVQAGKKGVLHTRWAKRRLQVLTAEIEAGVRAETLLQTPDLSRARSERDWIHEHFGVHLTSSPSPTATRSATKATAGSSKSPNSPASGGLKDKPRGLGLQLSDTTQSPSEDEAIDELQPTLRRKLTGPMSPEQTDVAVGSFAHFAAIRGVSDAQALAAKAPQRSISQVVSSSKTDSHVRTAANSTGDVEKPLTYLTPETGHEDGLFALPLSPRGDATQSPFTFDTAHTGAYLGVR